MQESFYQTSNSSKLFVKSALALAIAALAVSAIAPARLALLIEVRARSGQRPPYIIDS